MTSHTSTHRSDGNPIRGLRWRTSSYSGDQGTCVEVALLDDGRTAVRNSNDPDGGLVIFTRAEIAAFFAGVRAGEFAGHE